MTFDVKLMTCLHVCLSYQHLPPIDLPVFIPCQPIFPDLSPGDIGVFGVCFRGMTLCLAVLDSPWCPTFLHYTRHAHFLRL